MTTPPTKTPPATSARIASDHLAPVRAWVHAAHGRLTVLTDAMNRMTSTAITRQAVSRWLHQDEAKRQEPKLGIALVMEKAIQEIQCGQPAESAES